MSGPEPTVDTPRGAPPRRGLAFRVAAAVGVPLVLLLLLEGGLRIAGYDRPPGGPILRFVNPDRLHAEAGPDSPSVPDDALFWRMRPGWTDGGTYAINSRGFRGPEFDDAKLPGTRRVLVLGDSTAYGLRVDRSASWAVRAGHALRNRLGTDGIEVVNLAVPGYTSHQGLVLYRTEGRRLAADVVVAAFGSFNDWVPAVGRPDALQTERPAWLGLRVVQLAFALLASPPVDAAATTYAEAESRVRELDTRSLDGPRRVPLDDFEANLSRLAREVHADGARLVLVAQPLPTATRERNPAAAEYAARTRTVAGRDGDGLADGWSAFLAMNDADTLFLDFCHPSEEGHARLATLVADAVEPLLRRD